VTRSFIRRVIYCLVAGQALLSAPMVNAMTGGAPAAGHEMPCADSMSAADADRCPCCPDGDRGVAACLTSCTAMVAPMATLVIPAVVKTTVFPSSEAQVPRARASDPPLKPPPIR